MLRLSLIRRHLSDCFRPGDLVLLEDKGRKRMTTLVQSSAARERLEIGVHLSSNDFVSFSTIVGLEPGSFARSKRGKLIFLQRPSLEEYVLHMARGPTPMYPKDAAACLTMMDVGNGHRVLECGTGSGALTLFLSRLVGPAGRVFSFEEREDHLARAMKNVDRWIDLQNRLHSGSWKRNITFYSHSPSESNRPHMDGLLDSAVLDLQEPSFVLRTIIPWLKVGSPVVVYLPNITQVVQMWNTVLKEGLAVRKMRTVEVMHRLWSVDVARRHNREVVSSDIDSQPAYIARPSHHQQPHTGFLLLMRTSNKAHAKTE